MAEEQKKTNKEQPKKESAITGLKKKLEHGLRSAEEGVRKGATRAKAKANLAKEKLSGVEDTALAAKLRDKTSGMKKSYLWAGLISLGLILWLGSGLIFSGRNDPAKQPQEETSEFTKVEVKQFVARPRDIIITASGRTEGFRRIDVLARTTGIILSTPHNEGERVKKGDLLCELDLGVRQARLDEAKAALAEAQLNYDAAKELVKEGFASKTRMATTEARLDATKAALKQVEIDIGYTRITAPESGVLVSRPAEPGSFLQLGGRCATVTIQNPILIVANISEREVGGMEQGLPGKAKLATGRIVEGKVRFVSPAADATTRTFRVELEVDNKDLSIRDGISAQMSIAVDKKFAHLISPSILTLDKEGKIGVRMWKNDNTTAFTPVSIISDGTEGVWITGLPNEAVLVTVGHEYIKDGEKVNAIGLPKKITSPEVSQK